MTIEEAWNKLEEMFPEGSGVRFDVDMGLSRPRRGKPTAEFELWVFFDNGERISTDGETLETAFAMLLEKLDKSPSPDVSAVSAGAFELLSVIRGGK